MNKMNKARAFKITIIILSVLLVVVSACAVYLGINSYKKSIRINDEMSIRNVYEDAYDERNSEYNSLEEKEKSESQSYEDKISSDSSVHQSEKDALKSQIDDLNKKLEQLQSKATSAKPAPPSMPPIVPQSGKTVYLTFDDGPSSNTPAILDILDKYGVKATFFVINSGRNNKYMKDIVNRGHQIALHSYSHDYSKIYSSDEAYFNDLQKISDLVKTQTGVETKVIRFPGGGSNTVSKKYSKGIMTRLSKSVTEKGYVYFDWNCSNGDATGQKTSVQIQLDYCSQYPKSASQIVVLMHDVGNKKVTVESLPKIIEYYQSCGMKFDVLTENTPPIHHHINN